MKLSDRHLCQRALTAAIAAVLGSTAAMPSYTAEETGGIEEVVVTAQFRSQKLQDTPIAITAVNAALLESRNQNSLADVTRQAPNVNLRETGGAFGPGMSAQIRGVGQADFDPAFEPGVGIYIDDVYYSSLTGANFDLLDLDRVEIARGPQGVLGGRNSEGGSVKLYSQKPQGDDSGCCAPPTAAAAWSTFAPRATSRWAKTSSHASRVSKKQNGYVTRLDYSCVTGTPRSRPVAQGDCILGHEGGKDYSAGRAALRWLANDNLEVNLSADITVDNSESAAIVLQAVNANASGALASRTFNTPYTSAFVPADPSPATPVSRRCAPRTLRPAEPAGRFDDSVDPDHAHQGLGYERYGRLEAFG